MTLQNLPRAAATTTTTTLQLQEVGHLVSGTSTIEGMSVLDNNVAYIPPGKVSIVNQGNGTNRVGDRSLSISSNNTRPRYILAVRVTDSNSKVNPATADIISDKLFGTYGDSFTMKSQMEACSFGSQLKPTTQ